MTSLPRSSRPEAPASNDSFFLEGSKIQPSKKSSASGGTKRTGRRRPPVRGVASGRPLGGLAGRVTACWRVSCALGLPARQCLSCQATREAEAEADYFIGFGERPNRLRFTKQELATGFPPIL